MSASNAPLQWSLKILLRSEYNEVARAVVVHHPIMDFSHKTHFIMLYVKGDEVFGAAISPLS